MIGTALQEMATAPLLLPPEGCRVVNPLFPFISVPKYSIKEWFLSSPGPKRARKVVRGAKPLHSHPPMREQGVCILNYLDDWLILARSREQLCEHRDSVLSHHCLLGLQVNWEKSKLAPVQRISFLCIELDSVKQSARLTEEHAQSVFNCLNTFRGRTAVPLKNFQRLPRHMAATAAVTPLGLLYMRPLQHWLHGRVPRWAWQRGTNRVAITSECRQAFSPWSDPLFLWAGVPLEQVSRHAVVFTNTSATVNCIVASC